MDDSDDFRETVVCVLGEAGFEVVQAGNGTDALAVATNAVDLVILDVHLPDIDGYALCRQIKNAVSSIPVLQLSGVYRQVEDRVRGLDTGADAYLTKPVDPTELVATIRALLRLRRAEASLRESELHRRTAESLVEVAGVLAQSLDPEEVAQRIVDSVRTLLGAEFANVYRVNLVSQEAIVLASSGDTGQTFNRREVLAAGTGLIGVALREGRVAVTPNVLTDPRVIFTADVRARIERATYRAVLVVPLAVRGQVVGAVGVGDREGRVFTNEDIAFVQGLADHGAVALENARLYEDARDTRDFLRSIAENSADAIITTDVRGRITYFTPGAEEMSGYRAADVIGRPVAEFYGGGRPEAEALMQRLQTEGRIRNYEMMVRVRDGSWRVASASLSLLRGANGAVSGTLGIVKDITERKQVEETLKESEERFRGAFDHSAVGMALQDLQGTYLQVNQALCTMLGYTETELLGLTYHALTHPDDAHLDRAYDERVRRGDLSSYQTDKRYRHKRGSIVWCHLSVSVISDTAGRPRCFIVQMQDITARKQSEAAQAELEAQLRQALKLEAIGRLAGGVAHDFNNLLTVIRGRSDLLLRRGGLEDRARRDLDLILKTADRATRLTQQLLAFSRRQILQPTLLDLNGVVTQMESMLRRLIGEHIELITLPSARIGRVSADRGQLEQVIMNLTVNARDAMPDGGVLTIETADAELDERFVRRHPGSRPGTYVALTVTDTGHGMDEKVRARVFEPFFTTKGLGRGTGLGLATVYGIVKQSGGYITVESEPGRGTRFEVYLPRVDEPTPIVDARSPAEALQWGSETVLVVEDEGGVLNLAREFLELSGYTVIEAHDGAEAIRLAADHSASISLLLTDVVMPGMSGPELATRLRAAYPSLKVLYMSGYTDDTLVHHGVPNRSTRFLHKPFTPEELARVIREVLDDGAGKPGE